MRRGAVVGAHRLLISPCSELGGGGGGVGGGNRQPPRGVKNKKTPPPKGGGGGGGALPPPFFFFYFGRPLSLCTGPRMAARAISNRGAGGSSASRIPTLFNAWGTRIPGPLEAPQKFERRGGRGTQAAVDDCGVARCRCSKRLGCHLPQTGLGLGHGFQGRLKRVRARTKGFCAKNMPVYPQACNGNPWPWIGWAPPPR